jgi:hypothetical protein
MLIRFILGVSYRVLGSKVQGSGFWVQKFQDLSVRFLAVVLFPLTSDDLFLQLSNL